MAAAVLPAPPVPGATPPVPEATPPVPEVKHIEMKVSPSGALVHNPRVETKVFPAGALVRDPRVPLDHERVLYREVIRERVPCTHIPWPPVITPDGTVVLTLRVLRGESQFMGIILDNGVYSFECPYCFDVITVAQDAIACTIFRHGWYKNTNLPIPPHSSLVECNRLVREGLINGCGLPYIFNGKERWLCGYI